MYISKEKTRKINALALRMKVHTRNAAFAAGKGSDDIHDEHWDIAHYAHFGMQALLGDAHSREMVKLAKDHGSEEATYIWDHYVGYEDA